MDTISLGNPENVGANDLDGVKIRFPYTYQVPDLTVQGTITVSATGGDLITHQLGTNINPDKNDKLIKQFRAIAQKEIEIRAEKNTLSTENIIIIKY